MRTATPVRARPARPAPPPDPAFAARPRLVALRDALRRAARDLRPARPTDAAVFFFDPARQAELVAARPAPGEPPPHPVEALVAAELPGLLASVEVRHVARAVPGLRDAAVATAGSVPAARDLANLLAVADDEVVAVLHPAERLGFRLHVRGVSDLARLYAGLLGAAAGDPADGFLPPAADGYQMFRPAALRPDGSLPTGFGGCDDWLWGREPLSALPRVDGERVVLLGDPAYPRRYDAEPRFPDLAAEVELLRVLGPFEVADRIRRLTPTGSVPRPAECPARLTRAA